MTVQVPFRQQKLRNKVKLFFLDRWLVKHKKDCVWDTDSVIVSVSGQWDIRIKPVNDFARRYEDKYLSRAKLIYPDGVNYSYLIKFDELHPDYSPHDDTIVWIKDEKTGRLEWKRIQNPNHRDPAVFEEVHETYNTYDDEGNSLGPAEPGKFDTPLKKKQAVEEYNKSFKELHRGDHN